MLELFKKIFGEKEVQQKQVSQGLIFGSSVTKYYISKKSLENTVKNFPFLKNAVKAGLISHDKKTKTYYTTSEILGYRSTDKRKLGKRQFFSFTGVDDRERTTLHDALVTISNVKQVANKFNLSPKMLKYTIRHKDGNPEDVVNFIKIDARIFGNNPEQIQENINKINNVVKFERKKTYVN